jgi:membrane-associated protease RseP (regulator of RpoE activity)
LGGVAFNFITFLIATYILNLLLGYNLLESFTQTFSFLDQVFHVTVPALADPSKLSGPIGVLSDTIASSYVQEQPTLLEKFNAALSIFAQYSFSIGLVNLFPFPLLDGGQILRETVARIFPKSGKFLTIYTRIGNVFFGFLFVFIMQKEILALIFKK